MLIAHVDLYDKSFPREWYFFVSRVYNYIYWCVRDSLSEVCAPTDHDIRVYINTTYVASGYYNRFIFDRCPGE